MQGTVTLRWVQSRHVIRTYDVRLLSEAIEALILRGFQLQADGTIVAGKGRSAQVATFCGASLTPDAVATVWHACTKGNRT